MAIKDRKRIKDKESKPKISSGVNKLAKAVQDNLDALYAKVNFSKPTNKHSLDYIKTSIDGNIDKIISNNLDNTGVPNISKLYTRLGNNQNDKDITKQIQSVFDDKVLMDNVLSSYMQTTYLKDLDNEIDIVCKYMPRLVEALDTRKDNVLSSDHFSKDFLNIYKNDTIATDETLKKNIDTLKDQYNLSELIDTIYDKASRYGEQFLYIVPYKKAIAKLLASKGATSLAAKTQLESGIISESVAGIKPFKLEKIQEGFAPQDISQYNIQLEISQTDMLDSVVESKSTALKKRMSISEHSVNLFTEGKIDKSITADLDYSNFEKDKDTSSDGLITTDKDDEKKFNIKIPGCVVKKIDRTNIVPIYIEDICMGYYYFEFKENDQFNYEMKLSNTIMTSSKSSNGKNMYEMGQDPKHDQMLRYISGQLSKFIDSKFINKNCDLRREIYMILKHNDLFNTPSTDKIKVTFLPPEDVIHVYFKKDEKTNRGVSDLANSLLAAKFYSSLWITNAIAIMTRGQDKRVYYVKQNIETNIAKVLLNTIEQIKKSNFGIRQIENMNNVLNIVGKFNDYIIPVGPSGDSPVQFEVMQGQQVEIKTELMNMLEEMAINCTDVPLELIQARQSIDYAVQLTMTNSKFLRKVYNRQAKFQRFVSEIITKIYNAEYDCTEKLTIMLPPPMFLNVTNTNQIMDNVNQLVQSIVNIEMADEDDEKKKAKFVRELTRHYLGTYLDFTKIDMLKEKAAQETSVETNPNDQQQ